MFIEQIIEFELRGPGLPGRSCNLKTGYFYDKTRISKQINLRENFYLLLSILQKAMFLACLRLDQVNYKIYQKNAWV